MTKPFHLMTPAERTAARIAQNREISERVAETQTRNPRPPTKPNSDYTRGTPEEQAKRGGVIRKVPS